LVTTTTPPTLRKFVMLLRGTKTTKYYRWGRAYSSWILNRIRQLPARHGEITQNWFMANMYDVRGIVDRQQRIDININSSCMSQLSNFVMSVNYRGNNGPSVVPVRSWGDVTGCCRLFNRQLCLEIYVTLVWPLQCACGFSPILEVRSTAIGGSSPPTCKRSITSE